MLKQKSIDLKAFLSQVGWPQFCYLTNAGLTWPASIVVAVVDRFCCGFFDVVSKSFYDRFYLPLLV